MATTTRELSLLDFQLPCEADEGCEYQAPADWVLRGAPPCQHRLSLLICDYHRIAFQKWVADETRLGASFACGVCEQPYAGHVYDYFQLSPLRGSD